MKQLFFVAIVVPTLFLTDANLADISRALGAGNAEALGQYFDSSVELSILNQEDVYSKAQAIQLVKQFFIIEKPYHMLGQGK